jgi:hypothetical protein
MTSIATKIGCAPQTPHDWVKKAEIDNGRRTGVPTYAFGKTPGYLFFAGRLSALERR